jgi:hypothetical protein
VTNSAFYFGFSGGKQFSDKRICGAIRRDIDNVKTSVEGRWCDFGWLHVPEERIDLAGQGIDSSKLCRIQADHSDGLQLPSASKLV